MRRAVQILEAADDQSLSLADNQMFLANVYLRQAKFAECESLLKHALKIRQQHLGPDHLEVADAMFDLARVYRKTERSDESEEMYTKAKDILARHHEQEQYI
jgi:tetratricopeptide (TPR) repeat protein